MMCVLVCANMLDISLGLNIVVVADVEIWLLGVIFVLAGYPLSYFLWYRPLYRAMRCATHDLKLPSVIVILEGSYVFCLLLVSYVSGSCPL